MEPKFKLVKLSEYLCMSAL